MKINKFDEKLECHNCGKITRVYSIKLSHLCQHWLGLCPKCIKQLAQLITEALPSTLGVE